LDARAFSYWSIKEHDWRIQPGTYAIMAGPSSQDVPLVSSVVMQ
jgi:hypothetical protein